MKKFQILSGFWIRIIALVTMVIDHLAVLLVAFNVLSIESNFYYVLRVLGRLSLPLFAFGIVEGVLHTKNEKKYLLRLGLMAFCMSFAIVAIDKVFKFSLAFSENIFLTLFLGALAITLLKKKNWIKFLSIIPIGLSLFGNFTILAPYINPQYGLYGVLMIVLMYLANLLAHKLSKGQAEKYNVRFEDYLTTSYHQKNINLMYAVAIVFINVFLYIVTKFSHIASEFFFLALQDYSIISIFVVILYSGKRGYDSKWFRIFNYLFYPLHLIIMYTILFIIF